uniref:Uncharacterized protein n=1 Tax=Arundo donax TaxID=35708 RepID=A0A0A9C416_ARUDO
MWQSKNNSIQVIHQRNIMESIN